VDAQSAAHKAYYIGDFAYVGSEVRMAPGSSLPSRCVVGIGSVVTKQIDTEGWLIAGVAGQAG